MKARTRTVTEWCVVYRREEWRATSKLKYRRYFSRRAAVAFIKRLRRSEEDYGTVRTSLKRRRATFGPWTDVR